MKRRRENIFSVGAGMKRVKDKRKEKERRRKIDEKENRMKKNYGLEAKPYDTGSV
jgi:hypothetical protein